MDMSSIGSLLRIARLRGTEQAPVPADRFPLQPIGKAPVDLPQAETEAEIVALYEKNASALYRYGLAICGNSEMAQDAVQEAFLRFYVNMRKDSDSPDARGWLYSTTRNYILDRLKEYYFRNGRSLEEASHLPEVQKNPEERFIINEIGDRAREVLSPRELQCLLLRHEGLRYRDIADTLGIDSGTVGAFLARALKKIRTAFAPQDKTK